MKVTVFGAGNMARGIGTRLAAGGNDIQVIGPSADKVSALVEELRGRAAGGASVEGGRPGDQVTGEAVVLAVWYDAASSILAEHGDQLAGRVVIDITNPVDVESFDRLVTPADSSGAEELAAKAAPGTKLVKAFNTTFAGTLVSGEVAGQPLDVFIAGDDDQAKAMVAELAESGGLRPIDAGPLKRAHELEHLGFLHMKIQDSLGTGFGSAIKVMG
jgi:8-hydroxy-5-deazaflavin:NADPH oxidoreductase